MVMVRLDFPNQFRKVKIRYELILKGYNFNGMRYSACLVINQFPVDVFAALFNCTPVDRVSYSVMASTQSYSVKSVGPGHFSHVALSTGA